MCLFFFPKGVWSADWKVIFKNQCALKGASVVIKCQYDYPAGHIVTSVQWSKALYERDRRGLFPLSELSSARDHFTYVGNYWSDCGLKISNVQHTDEGQYFFSFWTTFSRWTSSTHAYLSVKGKDSVFVLFFLKKGPISYYFDVLVKLTSFFLCLWNRVDGFCKPEHCDRGRCCESDLCVII